MCIALMIRHETMGDLAEAGFTRDQILDALRILPVVSVISCPPTPSSAAQRDMIMSLLDHEAYKDYGDYGDCGRIFHETRA